MSVERADEVDDGELMADLIVQVYSELTHEAASTPRADAPEDGGAAQGASQSLIINEQRNAIADSQQITATDATARAQATRARTRRMEQTGRADLLEPVAPVPRQILLPFAPARADELEQWLSGLRGGAVSITVPMRGNKKQLLDRADQNAQQALQRSKMSRISDIGTRTAAMNDVAQALDWIRPHCASNATTSRTPWEARFRWRRWWCSKTASPRNPNTGGSRSAATTALAHLMTFPRCTRR